MLTINGGAPHSATKNVVLVLGLIENSIKNQIMETLVMEYPWVFFCTVQAYLLKSQSIANQIYLTMVQPLAKMICS